MIQVVNEAVEHTGTRLVAVGCLRYVTYFAERTNGSSCPNPNRTCSAAAELTPPKTSCLCTELSEPQAEVLLARFSPLCFQGGGSRYCGSQGEHGGMSLCDPGKASLPLATNSSLPPPVGPPEDSVEHLWIGPTEDFLATVSFTWGSFLSFSSSADLQRSLTCAFCPNGDGTLTVGCEGLHMPTCPRQASDTGTWDP